MPGENFPGDRIVSLVDELEGSSKRLRRVRKNAR